MKLISLIRHRYPYTAGGVLYVLAAVTALPFRPVRKIGEVMLAVLAASVLTVAARYWGNRKA